MNKNRKKTKQIKGDLNWKCCHPIFRFSMAFVNNFEKIFIFMHLRLNALKTAIFVILSSTEAQRKITNSFDMLIRLYPGTHVALSTLILFSFSVFHAYTYSLGVCVFFISYRFKFVFFYKSFESIAIPQMNKKQSKHTATGASNERKN